jgi:copper chaperone CopZ
VSVAVIRLELSGLVAIHAARAAYQALAAVPGIMSAQVTMAGATIDVTEPIQLDEVVTAVRRALEEIGIGVVSAVVVQKRSLPLA